MTVAQSYRMIPLADLTTHPENPRQGDIGAIHQSITVNGFYGALVVQKSTGRILAGNHRYLAAREAGLVELPAIVVDVDDDRARRILLVDNRSNDVASYDEAELARLLKEMVATPAGLAGTGFDGDDLDSLLANLLDVPAPLANPDSVPVVPKVARAKTGDVWLLGAHRLACGDSTKPGTLDAVMGGGLADCVWTDPPYGVDYVGKTSEALTIDNDGRDLTLLEVLLRSALGHALQASAPGAAWYVMGPAGPSHLLFAGILADLGCMRQTLVWVKDRFVLGHADYHYRHEPILYGYAPGASGRRGRGGAGWHGDNAQDSVIEVPRPSASKDHPTMKPVALIERCLTNSTAKGDVVLDPFAGSGSTLIACHQLGRVARLVELDPRYSDVVCRRWQEATEVLPVLESTGKAHDFTT